jgi:hypothetical protein
MAYGKSMVPQWGFRPVPRQCLFSSLHQMLTTLALTSRCQVQHDSDMTVWIGSAPKRRRRWRRPCLKRCRRWIDCRPRINRS